MSYIVLPSPIAYGRHLVDTVIDERAKTDQIRVLVQNTFQLLAAILVCDCAEKGIAKDLPSLPSEKRFSFGDFVSITCEASQVLLPYGGKCYVPELAKLYGASNEQTRIRKERGHRFASMRNEDVHSASLGQTARMLEALGPEVGVFVEELQFLENYLLVAVNSLVVSPDMKTVRIQGRRCHGAAREYSVISVEGMQYASCGEVILAKPGKPNWLSLRPWFLFSYDDIGFLNQGIQELLLISAIEKQKLRYCGLTSGNTYWFDTNEWLSGTAFAESTEISVKTIEDMREAILVPQEKRGVKPDLVTKPVILGQASDTITQGNEAQQSILRSLLALPFISSRQMKDGNIWILAQTMLKAVPIGSVNIDGSFWVNAPSLLRAAEQGLINRKDIDTMLRELPNKPLPTAQEITLSAEFMRTAGTSWLLGLLDKFKHITGSRNSG